MTVRCHIISYKHFLTLCVRVFCTIPTSLFRKGLYEETLRKGFANVQRTSFPRHMQQSAIGPRFFLTDAGFSSVKWSLNPNDQILLTALRAQHRPVAKARVAVALLGAVKKPPHSWRRARLRRRTPGQGEVARRNSPAAIATGKKARTGSMSNYAAVSHSKNMSRNTAVSTPARCRLLRPQRCHRRDTQGLHMRRHIQHLRRPMVEADMHRLPDPSQALICARRMCSSLKLDLHHPRAFKGLPPPTTTMVRATLICRFGPQKGSHPVSQVQLGLLTIRASRWRRSMAPGVRERDRQTWKEIRRNLPKVKALKAMRRLLRDLYREAGTSPRLSQ